MTSTEAATRGCRRPLGCSHGFSIVELLVGLALAGFLVAGVVTLTLAASGSYRLQQGLAALQENARFALQAIGREARQAGYQPEPWSGLSGIPAIAVGTADGATPGGDRLVFRRLSDRNCYANDNPATDAGGRPLFWILENAFHVSGTGNLVQTCRFGPDPASLTTQVNGLGLVQNVEALHALFAEDTDSDGDADRWVNAASWLSESGVVGVEVAILLASPGSFRPAEPGNAELLDEVVPLPGDGRLRRVFSAAFSIRGRAG